MSNLELSEILKICARDCMEADFILPIIECSGIESYMLTYVGSREELRILDKQTIPKKGGAITCISNYKYASQNDEFKLKYPELNFKTHTILIEIVKDIQSKQDKVNLIIDKYLIRRNY